MSIKSPGEVELISHFRRHLGPRFESAGLRVQFHYNQVPGIHFKAEPSEEYRVVILQGLKDGMALHFPNFPESGSVWITEVVEHEADSSAVAFYKAARLVIEQAASLVTLSGAQEGIQPASPAFGGAAG